jgi:hypothetical protein
MDSKAEYFTIHDLDIRGEFPRIYKCMGKDILIERDANWQSSDSILVMYDYLADEISKIEGIKALPSGENGIMFQIDVNKIKNFKFLKPPYSSELDTIEFITDGQEYLKFTSDFINSKSRLMDKSGKAIKSNEISVNLPLSRFSI